MQQAFDMLHRYNLNMRKHICNAKKDIKIPVSEKKLYDV